MIRKVAEMETEVRPALRGGPGAVTLQHLFKPNEVTARTRLCARLILPPGAGIGLHAHEGEDELFVVTRGSGLVEDAGTRQRVEPGDAILTGKGSSHAVHNDGPGPLEMIALILLY